MRETHRRAASRRKVAGCSGTKRHCRGLCGEAIGVDSSQPPARRPRNRAISARAVFLVARARRKSAGCWGIRYFKVSHCLICAGKTPRLTPATEEERGRQSGRWQWILQIGMLSCSGSVSCAWPQMLGCRPIASYNGQEILLLVYGVWKGLHRDRVALACWASQLGRRAWGEES